MLNPESGANESKNSRTLQITTLLNLAFLGIVPPDAALWIRLFPAVLATLITIVAVRRRTEGTELTVVVFGLAWLVGLGVLWQVAMPLSVLGVIFWSRRAPTSKGPPLARGRIPVALTLFTGLVTPGALLGWVYWMRPDLSDFTSATTDMPLAILIAGGAIFALVNATFEEWIWRGMIQSRLTTSFGLGWAIALQALSFGLAHTWGFPRGVVGVFLAGSWAVLLGILRHKAGGLLAPILAHIVADATIASIVIWVTLNPEGL